MPNVHLSHALTQGSRCSCGGRSTTRSTESRLKNQTPNVVDSWGGKSNHLDSMQIDSPADESCRVSRPRHQTPAIPNSLGASLHHGIPELSDLLLACRHHALLTFVVGGAMAAALALLAWAMILPNYHAEALVRVRENESVIFRPQTSRSEDIAFFRSQAALVRSHQVLSASFDDDEVQNFTHVIPDGDRVEWLDGLLRVETQSGPEVISVTAHHETPVVAQAFCNAVTRAYLAEIKHRISSDRQLREKRLEQAAVAADTQLDKLWEDLNGLAQSVGADSSESLTIRDQMQFQSYRDYAPTASNCAAQRQSTAKPTGRTAGYL